MRLPAGIEEVRRAQAPNTYVGLVAGDHRNDHLLERGSHFLADRKCSRDDAAPWMRVPREVVVFESVTVRSVEVGGIGCSRLHVVCDDGGLPGARVAELAYLP
jgi:hypothetical protein